MNTSYFPPPIAPDPSDLANRSVRGRLPIVTDEALSAARARLATATQASRRLCTINAYTQYYGVSASNSEEAIEGLASSDLDALITRNHYGCLVLNAARTLFIDVDFEPDADWNTIDSGSYERPTWETMFDDLSIVLRHETDLGFRVYCTKAGFRMLATNWEFEPESPRATELMQAVSADADFVQLCRIQNNFRARLTPKPWRCGVKRPPNFFPRNSVADQRAFSAWLVQYEQACRGRATCRYVGHLGPAETHPRIAPVIEFHDRQTKALEPLPLA